MENPTSVWLLAEGSIRNTRFLFFVLLPSILLALTLFATPLPQHQKLVFQRPRRVIQLGVWGVILIMTLSLAHYYPILQNRIGATIINVRYGYERNPLIAVYEAIANYLVFEKKLVQPNDITEIRKMFRDGRKRNFTDKEFPLMHRPLENTFNHFSPNNNDPPKNIIILMLESFPSTDIYALSRNPVLRGLTPFLDSIISQSLYFPNTYASGMHTFYGFTDLFVGNPDYQYQNWNKKLISDIPYALSHPLRAKGYNDLAYYHGIMEISFDFQPYFFKMLDFNLIRHYDHYPPEAVDANWGKSDRDTLKLAAEDIKNLQAPFLTFILTLTRHGPWKIPHDFDHYGFERDYLSQHGGKIPNPSLQNSHQLLYYYDQVLKEFFTTLEGNPNFENSLVIITSDQAFFSDIKGSKNYPLKNAFNIPLIFYEPGKKTLTPGRNPVFASHLDLIPTLIDYLDLEVPETIPYQGRNLLNPIHQNRPDVHSHIAFWQDDLLHFTQDGIYKLSSTPENNTVIRIDTEGQEHPSKDEDINQMMKVFKEVYPYLIKNNLVFPANIEARK